MKNPATTHQRIRLASWHCSLLCGAVLMALNGCGGGSGDGRETHSGNGKRNAPLHLPGDGQNSSTGVLDENRPIPRHETIRHPAPRGLANPDGTCYINAPLQLILHSQALRDAALTIHPNDGLQALYAAYDARSRTEDAQQAVDRRRDHVVRQLAQQAQNIADLKSTVHRTIATTLPVPGPGDTIEATAALLDHAQAPFSAAIQLFDYDNPDHAEIRAYYGNGVRFFALPEYRGYDLIEQLADATGGRLVGFVRAVGGHFVAYVCVDNQWFLIDDAVVTPVLEDDLYALPVVQVPIIDVVVQDPIRPDGTPSPERVEQRGQFHLGLGIVQFAIES